MASAKTRGPVEQRLLELLNRAGPITIEDVQALLTEWLDCSREDMYEHMTFAGTMWPERSNK